MAPPWVGEAIRGVERRIGGVRPPLGERIRRAARRITRIDEGGSLEAALSLPAATPFLALIEALRGDFDVAPEDPRVRAIGEGALLLYMQVRVQDDLVDEPEEVDRGDVFVIEALSGASVCAFASAVGDGPAFFTFREEIMRRFSEAAARELDARRNVEPEGAEEKSLGDLGLKFLPMAVPLGALAFAAGRAGDAASLVDFVTALGGALQMVNDILNAGEDHAARRPTPVLRWLSRGGRLRADDAAGRVRALLLSDPALEQALSHARAEAARAERIATSMGADTIAEITRERAAFMSSVPERLFALCLGSGAR